MKEILVTNIKKEKGILYFCKANKDDYITVCEAKAGRPKKEKESVSQVKEQISHKNIFGRKIIQ